MLRSYSNVGYADMVFVYGFCDGNATEAVREYVRRFPNRRVPDRRVITMTFNRLREIGSFSIHQDSLGVKIQVKNRTLHHFDNNPETSVRRASVALQLPRQRIYRTLRNDNRHPYHIQKMQNLLPQDYFKRLNFSNAVNVWLEIWNDSLLKQEVYSSSVNSREQLRNRIEVAVHQISPDQCLAATRTVHTRCLLCCKRPTF
ncbi:hypothetical protein ALC60_07178 [Trachymyrmex zeteki]|uniref:DUF4817 domain-containing protein n=1 Tax=Mycetomoellerius zeteki TaxID=64791 RepID=A0A151X0W1_9HYME|nr:hypothetical protein ALC60_07178 [Trachymyrmex zeteki]